MHQSTATPAALMWPLPTVRRLHESPTREEDGLLFPTILVPLDGSELAERVLVHLDRLLRREDARVVLLRVVSPSESSMGVELAAARAHVERLAADLAGRGARASGEVQVGDDPAAEILRRATELSASLVAMTTHGRSGVLRWVRGSVAERVLRAASTPLLLINPQVVERGRGFGKILVPLDGSARSAEVVPIVEELARLWAAEVVLFHAAYAPGTHVHVLADPEQPRLHEALRPWRDRLHLAGLRVRTEVVGGEPAREILEALEREDVDLVALTTHGRTGLDRWVLGSVAEKVLRECRRPLLVVRRAADATGR